MLRNRGSASLRGGAGRWRAQVCLPWGMPERIEPINEIQFALAVLNNPLNLGAVQGSRGRSGSVQPLNRRLRGRLAWRRAWCIPEGDDPGAGKGSETAMTRRWHEKA